MMYIKPLPSAAEEALLAPPGSLVHIPANDTFIFVLSIRWDTSTLSGCYTNCVLQTPRLGFRPNVLAIRRDGHNVLCEGDGVT